MDKMKLSFMVEVTNCHDCCPHLSNDYKVYICGKYRGREKHKIYIDNRFKLTKSCPMIKKQFEMLE